MPPCRFGEAGLVRPVWCSGLVRISVPQCRFGEESRYHSAGLVERFQYHNAGLVRNLSATLSV